MPVLGVDTGGTFTDVVTRTPSGLVARKVESDPADPSRAVLAAVGAVGGLGAGGRVHHGTTVATNAVLTRTGARTGLVVTAGFEDLLEVGRGTRTGLHDLSPRRTPPLVARRDVFPLDERRTHDGRPLRIPTAAALRALAARIFASGVEAVAVCLLHAGARGAGEEAVERALRGTEVPVHLSHRVAADPREVERAETTVLDAYVGPMMRAYVARLAAALPSGALSVLRSDGTRMAPEDVEREPVRTLLSGPAAGAAAALALLRRTGLRRALSFDVGGTSTDVTWIEGESLPVTTGLSLGGFALGVPSLDVHSVGAGGGSVVRLDAGGALRVGPGSAGARPGPAAYGRGGPFTLTDAHLLLGRLPPALLGGAFPLDVGAARRAGDRLAKAAGLRLRRLCEGAIRVAETTTARALRVASAAAGRDPAGAALFAVGGAGGMLAARVAAELGLAEVVVPWAPGTFAAQGARLAPRAADASATVLRADDAALARRARELLGEARARLRAGGERGVHATVEVDARYRGQAFEIVLPFGPDFRARFHDLHRRRYGFCDASRAVEAVRLRARVAGPALPWDAPGAALRPGPARPAPPSGRLLGLAGAVPLVRRDELRPRAFVEGPAVVSEDGGTTWVPPGARAEAYEDGTLRVREARP